MKHTEIEKLKTDVEDYLHYCKKEYNDIEKEYEETLNYTTPVLIEFTLELLRDQKDVIKEIKNRLEEIISKDYC